MDIFDNQNDVEPKSEGDLGKISGPLQELESAAAERNAASDQALGFGHVSSATESSSPFKGALEGQSDNPDWCGTPLVPPAPVAPAADFTGPLLTPEVLLDIASASPGLEPADQLLGFGHVSPAFESSPVSEGVVEDQIDATLSVDADDAVSVDEGSVESGDDSASVEGEQSPIEGDEPLSADEDVTIEDRSGLLMSSSGSLSREIELLMSELLSSTDASLEQSLSQDLATYTAAARIRDALMSEDPSASVSLVADYRQLGFIGVDETTIGLANKVLKAALLSEGSSDLVGLVSSALMDFASLQSLVMPNGSGTDYAVTIDQDPAVQLGLVASKLEASLGDSDYDDVLVDFLREQLLDGSGKQVLATFESPEGMQILHSLGLPSALLAGMSSVDTLSVEGLDASGSWVGLRSFTAEDVVGGAVSLTPSYQGFSSFRLTTSTPMDAELRESLVGEAVTFSAQAELALPASLDVAGLSQLSALPGSMAVQLARWTGVETWDEYQALDSLSPMVSALHASYVDFYGEEPVSGELQALLRLSLLLSEAEASPFFAEMRSHCGSFCETDLELLTSVALDSVSLSSMLPELKAAYQSGEGVTDVMGQLHAMAWLEDSQQLLQKPVDTLIERLMIISNETPLDAQAERQVARLSSVVKFKQLLSGDADIEVLAITAEDYQHFGFADVTVDQSSLLTRQLSASSAVTPATLKSFVEEFQSSYAAASEAFDALLAGGNDYEQRVVLQAEDDLSSILSLLSVNFGEDSPAFNNLVSAITGYMSSTDRVLATLDISGAGIDYVDVSNVQGHAVMGDIPLYATLYEAASGEGTRVELIRDPAVAGRFWLPESVSMAGYSTLELGVTGYSGAIEQLAEATVVGSTRGLSAEHLSFFGYEDYDGRDAVALEQMAEAALRSNADLTLEGLLGTYDAARPMIQWQDESDFTHQQWDAMWQWGLYVEKHPGTFGNAGALLKASNFDVDELAAPISEQAQSLSTELGEIMPFGFNSGYLEFLLDRETGQPIWSFDDYSRSSSSVDSSQEADWNQAEEMDVAALQSIRPIFDVNSDWTDFLDQIDLGDLYQ